MAGYTRFDNPVLEKVLTSSFTKRQLKILLLIVRFSAGCQKTYAVLRKNDFSYARVSPYCIKGELDKLVKKKVVGWDETRDLLWINPNLDEWAVDNPGDKVRRFFKIANKNLLKWQMALYQNSKSRVANTVNISTGLKEKKEKVNKDYKENTLMNLVRDYFLKVSPLREDEMLILRTLAQNNRASTLGKAMDLVSQGNDRSFSGFLKTLESLANKTRPRRESVYRTRSSITGRLKNPSNQ